MSKIYVDEIAGIASPSTVAIPGHVIQVVEDTQGSVTNTTSTSYVDTTLEVSITPSSTSSKILIVVATTVTNTSTSTATRLSIFRDSTNIGAGGQDASFVYQNNGASGYSWVGAPLQVLDSPSSTSAITYSVKIKVSGGTGYVNWDDARASITAMEIAG